EQSETELRARLVDAQQDAGTTVAQNLIRTRPYLFVNEFDGLTTNRIVVNGAGIPQFELNARTMFHLVIGPHLIGPGRMQGVVLDGRLDDLLTVHQHLGEWIGRRTANRVPLATVACLAWDDRFFQHDVQQVWRGFRGDFSPLRDRSHGCGDLGVNGSTPRDAAAICQHEREACEWAPREALHGSPGG